ncbi:GGDEF domain-containing protein [Actinosynnema sp. NPDC020468]|uniref:GGDEF domain-containing protein n=1 Tax=Actinosynnema sp. NPDC020468 TaxID=3154488 RepID=UPI00340B82B5
MTAGWAYPADWSVPEVDEVCRAVLGADDPDGPLYRLGSARASAGIGLAETLLDLAALHAVVDEPAGSTGIVSANVDAIPTRALRVTALGWGDVMSRHAADRPADNPLTGLATSAYLLTRLREVYAETRACGHSYVLVFVSLDLSKVSGWSRVVAMTLLADALREVFDAGETLATTSRSTAVVLLRQDPDLRRRLTNLRFLAADRLAVDPHVAPTGPVRLRVVPLPATYEEATTLLAP